MNGLVVFYFGCVSDAIAITYLPDNGNQTIV